MLGIRDRQLTWLVGAMFAPFALQLLGWAQTPLGGGPCGAIVVSKYLLEQPQAFFYSQILLWGIALLMAVGFFLVMLAFMGDGRVRFEQAKPFVLTAAGIALMLELIYLGTRLVGLPAPSPVGWVVGATEPLDVVGVLFALIVAGLLTLCARWLASHPNSTELVRN
ncbi:MAG: hypothetical protein SFU83_10435 [Meiothermus sp.]|nr:hypothetical protein [Meiothermus sp.]